MAATALSCAVCGLDGVLGEVTVDIRLRPPTLVLVGLPDAAGQVIPERARAALRTASARCPNAPLTVHLAHVDLIKDGPTIDLPIASGILRSSGQLFAGLSDALLVGELSTVRAVLRSERMLTMVEMAAERGVERAFRAVDDAREAGLIKGIAVHPNPTLAALLAYPRSAVRLTPLAPANQGTVVE